MSKRRPTDAALAAPLSEGPFGADAELLGADPLEPTPLLLDLDQIEPYARNPRRSRNPLYDEIEDSIRHQGLEQPLVVTRAPGSERFVVKAGGNTRLAILKALHAETGEARFARVPCVYQPWSCESELLLGHLRENDLRGSLSFIERAQAIAETGRLIAAETDGEAALSQRQLAARLAERGYAVSQTLLSYLDYAAETLWSLIPAALGAGLGRHQVERIRALERAAAWLWEALDAGDAASFAAVFAELCRRYDGPEWRLNRLQRALEVEIAECAEVGLHQVSVQLADRLAGRDAAAAPAPAAAAGLDPEIRAVARRPRTESPPGEGSAAGSVDAARARGVLEPQPGAEAAPAGTAAPHPAGAMTGAEASGEATPSVAAPASHEGPLEPNALREPATLEQLRERASALACGLAERNGLDDVVAPLADQGLGFVVRDVPDPSLARRLDEAALAMLSMLWWQLAACAEITVAPLAAVLPHVAAGSVLERALSTQDAGLLFESVWTLDPGHTGYRLWQRLDERDWHDLVRLMDTYRQIHRVAAEADCAVWKVPP